MRKVDCGSNRKRLGDALTSTRGDIKVGLQKVGVIVDDYKTTGCLLVIRVLSRSAVSIPGDDKV